MNAVHNRSHPKVILLGYPLKRTVVTNQMKTKHVPSNSFPVLAVTRSNTAPCFVVSKSHPQKKTEPDRKSHSQKKTEPERQSSNVIYDNAKRSSQLHINNNSTGIVKCESAGMPGKNDPANRTRPRASSLPVWPVTDPNIIRNLVNDSTRTLPRPKVSANVVIYRPKQRNSACSGVFKDGQSHRDKTDNTRCPIIVNSKQPSRCETPMSEYDPDKLNIKQIVKFLDNDPEFSYTTSHSYREVSGVRPRPFTVAYTDSNTYDIAKYGHHRAKHRKSPPAAKRFMRSAKSTNSVERALSVSTLVMSDKRSAHRHYRRAKKIEKLANLAARYNPDINVNKSDTSNTHQQSFEQVNGNLSEECFGQMMYESASFHSFPTNNVEMVSEELCRNGKAQDSDDPGPEAETFGVCVSRPVESSPTKNRSDGASFNANNAIRLPSVFDNIDAESEVDYNAGYWSMPTSFEQITLSDNSDSPQSDSTIIGPCFRLSSHNNTRDNRHRRNLSMVFSRERSSEIPLCAKDDPKRKIKETRNWVNFAINDNSKVVELKLTHGLPPHL